MSLRHEERDGTTAPCDVDVRCEMKHQDLLKRLAEYYGIARIIPWIVCRKENILLHPLEMHCSKCISTQIQGSRSRTRQRMKGYRKHGLDALAFSVNEIQIKERKPYHKAKNTNCTRSTTPRQLQGLLKQQFVIPDSS
jgi:hypothetical protein